MSAPRPLPVLLSGALLAACPGWAQDTPAGAPPAPPTAGELALRVGERDPATLARLADALHRGDVTARAAAARLANVAGATALAEDLTTALAAETDPEAAGEEARALAVLGGAKSEEALLNAAGRLSIAGPVASALAWARGPAVLADLPRLRAAGLKRSADLVAIVTRGGRQEVEAVASRAVGGDDTELWSTLLPWVRRAGATLDASVLSAALVRPGLRQPTLWHLALTTSRERPLAPEVAAAVEGPPADGGDPEAAFAAELLRRARGEKPRVAGAWGEWLKQPKGLLGDLARDPAFVHLLTDAERTAIARALFENPKALDRVEKTHAIPVPRGEATDPLLATAWNYPPRYVAAVVAAAGCEPPQEGEGLGALVTYSPHGRPQKVAFPRPPGEGACERAARILLRSVLQDAEEAGRNLTQRFLVVTLQPERLACLEEPVPMPPVPLGHTAEILPAPGDAARIREPKKVKSVPPVYPRRAREERRQGLAVIDTVLAPSGCVHSAEVVVSAGPDLDWAAMRAILQWAYTPTLLDGRPVPVLMTVTINFTLH